MIGQINLQQTLKESPSKFILLIGNKGSGRKTIIQEVFGVEGYWLHNISVASVRTMIENVYQYHDTVFVIPDADNMSPQAKNALLKVVEECPNNNQFIMTLEDENNTLEPIKSRATIYHMEEYTTEDILYYFHDNYSHNEEEDAIVSELCENLGEVDLLESMGTLEFYSYVQKVVANITAVSGANAFKIADKISFKEDDGKYDLRMFLKAFMRCCVSQFHSSDKNDVLIYAQWCQITSKYIRELRITGINKQSLFDAWLLDIRATAL